MKDEDSASKDILQLARLGLTGRSQDVQLYLGRMLKRYRDELPELSCQLEAVLREASVRSSPLRREAVPSAIPVDLDSRLHLVRFEASGKLDVEPVLVGLVADGLKQLVLERKRRARLQAMGLKPTRTTLFVGEPGVGKTLAAKWLARELSVPLLTLDLAAVMSSFLGRTGNNVRYVLDYAKSVDCVLLLDELDAVAKRRDDTAEVGELKRLVTVLLQEIDGWPADGLLVAATNHPGLLDPAVWRRFELVLEFPMPEGEALAAAVRLFLGEGVKDHAKWARILSLAFQGASFSDIERGLTRARRNAAVSGESLSLALVSLLRSRTAALTKRGRAVLAAELVRTETVSQREAYELTGTSRDTIRKALRAEQSSS